MKQCGVIIIKNLVEAIFFSTILGLILLLLGIPGAILAFGIVVGSLFWGLYLLVEIRDNLAKITKQEEVDNDSIEDDSIGKNK